MKLTLSIIIFILICIIVLQGHRADLCSNEGKVSKKEIKRLEATVERLKADSSMLSKHLSMFDYKLVASIKKQGL